MSHSDSGAGQGHPVMLMVLGGAFLLLLLWMGSAAAPGGATHTHLVACGDTLLPCGSGNATASETPVGQSPLNYYDVPGGATDNFKKTYDAFTLIFTGILIFIAAMAGLVVWMARKPHRV